MEWIISILIALLIIWIGFCLHQIIEYDDHYESHKFNELYWHEKLVVITLWTLAATFVMALFIGLVMLIKQTIFGK